MNEIESKRDIYILREKHKFILFQLFLILIFLFGNGIEPVNRLCKYLESSTKSKNKSTSHITQQQQDHQK